MTNDSELFLLTGPREYLELYNCPPWLADKFIPHILAFFAEAGYGQTSGCSIGIWFDLEERPQTEDGKPIGGVGGVDPKGNPNHGFATIYMQHTPTMAHLVENLFHELDHILWGFQYGAAYNKRYDMDHDDRPHEKRAYATGRKYRRHLEFAIPEPTKQFFGKEYYQAVE
ncbi:MAG: hypothetical protein WD712_02985 [Candidatus Spechtbacterales bacterium]